MDLERVAAEFRVAARRAGPRGAGRRYPPALRRTGAEYFRRRRAVGASVATVARDLGVRRQTLLAWAAEAEAKTRAAFVPVAVVPDAAVASRIVVHGPVGLRIEGLDVATLAALLRAFA